MAIDPHNADLSAVTSRIWAMLRKADASCAETVEINENANDGSNEPTGITDHRVFTVQYASSGGQWLDWSHSKRIDDAREQAKGCKEHHKYVMIVASEVVEWLESCGHA